MNIVIKSKPFEVEQADESVRLAINFKRTVQRADCDGRPHQHAYFNSDLFPAMLNRAYRGIIGSYTEWAYIDALPAGVTIDTSKFLAVITVALPDNFR